MDILIKTAGYLVFLLYGISALWMFMHVLVQLHLLWHYKGNKHAVREPAQLPNLPTVAIQLPVYNEKYRVERMIQNIGQIRYPEGRLEIQVLDDSTDETSQIIDREVSRLEEKGVPIKTLRRQERKGYKAGALQQALDHTEAELIAIFDADFLPGSDFLENIVPYFSDPRVGLVQARWSHLNSDENALTRIQSILLDTHFSIEQKGRSNADYFINFCGTGGVWRKACIRDAGGWDGNMMSEDLDLSFRAQLKGWKLLYDDKIHVPAELPNVMEALKIQQFRWTKGQAQTSRKNLLELLHSDLPPGKKFHGAFHLLGSFVFVSMLVNALTTVPMIYFRNLTPEFRTMSDYTMLSSVNLLALTLVYYVGAKAGRGHRRFFMHYPYFLVVYLGLSVQNAMAVMQGIFSDKHVFERTPKVDASEIRKSSYLSRKPGTVHGVEMLILVYFIFGIMLSMYYQDYILVSFYLMIIFGLGNILYRSLT